jgi:hypothetical protein
LLEFRRIFASPRIESSDLSSSSAMYPLDRSVLSGAHANYANHFVRSLTPPASCTWPGDHKQAAATTSESPPVQDINQTIRAKWRSIRDYLRITTPAVHGQTVFSRESIDAVRSTSQRPVWRESSNAFHHRGTHPFELDGRQSLGSQSRKGSSTRTCTGKATSFYIHHVASTAAVLCAERD